MIISDLGEPGVNLGNTSDRGKYKYICVDAKQIAWQPWLQVLLTPAMSSPDASSSPSPTTPWQLQARMLGLHQGQTTIKVSTFESNCNQLLYSPVMRVPIIVLTCYARGRGEGRGKLPRPQCTPSDPTTSTVVLPTFSATPANFEIQSTRVQKSASPKDIDCVCRFSRDHG